MTLPALPAVPATVYVANVSEVRSSDLNDFETFMAAVKVFLDAGLFTRPALADNSPVIATTDRDGRIRHYTDPNGYWFGPAVQYLYGPTGESNQVGPVGPVAYNGLRGQADANCEFGEDFISTDNDGALQLTVLNAAVATQGTVLYRGNSHRNIDDLISVMEFRAQLNTVGASGVDVWFGLSNSTARTVPTSSTDHVAFVKKSTDTNWQAQVSETATSLTTTDTTVPPVASTRQTFRIEYHGANTPLGVSNTGAPVARFFIDGAMVHEDTSANIPVGTSQLSPVFGASAIGAGPTADFEMDICPIKYAYNSVLAGVVPA